MCRHLSAIGLAATLALTSVTQAALVSFRYGVAETEKWMLANTNGWPTLKAQADLLHGSEQEIGDMFATKRHQHECYFDGIAIGKVPKDYHNDIIDRIQRSESSGWQEVQLCLRRETMAGHPGPPGPFPWAENMLAQVDVDNCRAAITDAYNRHLIKTNHCNLLYLGSAGSILAAITNAASEAVLLSMDGIAVEIHYKSWSDGSRCVDTALAVKWCLDHNKIAQVHMGGHGIEGLRKDFIPVYQTVWSNLAALGVDYRDPRIIYHNNLNHVAREYIGPEWQWGQALWYTRWLINKVKGTNDHTAPAIPVVQVVASNATVSLKWDDVKEADMFAYKIYQSTNATGPFNLVQTLQTSYYLGDKGLQNGTTYYYKVTAVDIWDNESGASVVSTTPKSMPAGKVLP